MANVLRYTLMYGVLPLWVLAGLADWWCHRRTAIESTSGLRESGFHFLMFAQMGLAGLAVLLLEVNAAVFALLVALFALHEATTWLELRFVGPRRVISPAEQMVHSYMELLPLAALFLLAALHAGQLGLLPGAAPLEWQLRLKSDPLPPAYLATALLAIVLLNLLPLLEEALRCWRARAQVR